MNDQIVNFPDFMREEKAARAALEDRLKEVEHTVSKMRYFGRQVTCEKLPEYAFEPQIGTLSVDLDKLNDLQIEALRLAVTSISQEHYQGPDSIVAVARAFHAFLSGNKEKAVP